MSFSPTESLDAEHAGLEGWLYYTILYEGLEHPRILGSAGGLEAAPVDNEGWLYYPLLFYW